MKEKTGGEAKAESVSIAEAYDQMNVWLNDHPPQPPDAIRQRHDAWNERLRDPQLSEEEWKNILQEQREMIASVKGADEESWYRLLRLRDTPGSPGEIRHLEFKIASCYCGSGQKFSECHGK